jgi:ATP-dependent helicase HrpB
MQRTAAHGHQSLPVDAILDDLARALATRGEALLQAEPGAGKTTRVPLHLLDAPWLDGRRILLVEPRRLAARSAAAFIAASLGEAAGERVGYRVRGDSRSGPRTRLEVVTDGVFLRLLQADPALEGVGLVILDEFHERSVGADLALALLLQARSLLRDEDPLRLLLMSATLDGLGVSTLLPDAPTLHSAGRTHPVDIRYGASAAAGELPLEALLEAVGQAQADGHGDTLVFLPGQAEIRRAAAALAPGAGPVLSLHGGLSLPRQQAVLAPPRAGERRIILATDIAETSLTLPAVDAVVDSGLCREPRYDRASGMGRLLTRRISRASAEQRAGRAGRVRPGRCYRLWSREQHDRLEAQRPPPIRHADLATLALELFGWGAGDPGELDWLEAPPEAAFASACDLLERCGALEVAAGRRRLTRHGRRMLELPVHPRLAHMLLTAAPGREQALACELAALLEERPPADADEDLGALLEALASDRAGTADRAWRHAVRREVRRLRGLLGIDLAAGGDPAPLLARAYPERVGRRIARDRQAVYQLASGRRAALPGSSPLAAAPWLAIAAASGGDREAPDRVRLAAPLDPAAFDSALAGLVTEREAVRWDPAKERAVARRERQLGALLLASETLPAPDPARAQPLLLARVRELGIEALALDATGEQWRARVAFLRSLAPDAWPDLSDTRLLASLEEWLGPWLGKARGLDDLRSIGIRACLAGLLPGDGTMRLERDAPAAITVPSGRAVRLDYTQGPVPVLAVKLQELFGCAETPTVAGGRVPVLVHLLSPAGRPLQVTADLASFWREGYPAVRREQRGRYPKHPWPQDPLAAEATAATRRRR